MTGSGKLYWASAAVSLLIALYCFSGYAMGASLSTGADDMASRTAAVRWLTGAGLAMALAVALFITGWVRGIHGTRE
jgi:hypothetical protein